MNTAIIVAGGSGVRMGASVPKQFLLLGGKPILMRTIAKFFDFDNTLNIIVTLPKNQIEYWHELCRTCKFNIKHKIVEGGATRFQSVKNALNVTEKNSALIAVHDGVRPLVSIDSIERCFKTAEQKGVAIPVVEISDSIRRIKNESSEIVDRNGIFIIQTPQVFQNKIIFKAYEQEYQQKFTDDASVAENAGFALSFVGGNRENVKITRPEDIAFAEKLI